jgi:hypothetical protein
VSIPVSDKVSAAALVEESLLVSVVASNQELAAASDVG